MTKAERSVGILGLGYAGLPLALAFAAAGIRTVGYDIDQSRVAALTRGRSYLPDVAEERLRGLSDRFTATTDPAALAGAGSFIVCVPTPLTTSGHADLRHILAALRVIATHLRAGDLVIIQSTVPPGTTQAAARHLAEQTGLEAGQQFHIAMSPERMSPASWADWNLSNTPRLLGGLTPQCTHHARSLLSRVTERLVPVGNPEIAETAKIFENTFRLVNIVLACELAGLCGGLGIEVREVIEAAATKPYGFLPHWPGPGIGGECIPVDPLFLREAAARNGLTMPLVEAAAQRARQQPRQVVDRLAGLLRAEGGDLAGSRILVVGVSYKPAVADVRNAPALDIVRELRRRAAKPRYTDPFVHDLIVDGEPVERVEWEPAPVTEHDCLVLVTPHEPIMQRPLWGAAPLVLDTWHVLPRGDGVHYL